MLFTDLFPGFSGCFFVGSGWFYPHADLKFPVGSFSCRRQDPEMPDTDESFGEDMLAETAKEFYTGQGHQFLAVIPVIAPAECHMPVIDADQPVVADGNFMRIATQVFNHRSRPGKGLPGIDNPRMFKKLFLEPFINGKVVFKQSEKLAPEYRREVCNGKQI